MSGPTHGDKDTGDQLADLTAELAQSRADIAALQADAAEASRRAGVTEDLADAERLRIDALEARADIDRHMIEALQADGIVSREHAKNLEAALATSRMIGAAIGIVMAFYGVTETAAFDILRRASNDANRKLRLVAEEVVLTGDVSELQLS